MYFEACSAFYFDVSWLEERRITSPALATNNPHLAMPNLTAVSVNLQSHTTDLQELVALNSSYSKPFITFSSQSTYLLSRCRVERDEGHEKQTSAVIQIR